VSWEVEGSDEFAAWFGNLAEDEAESVTRSIDLLALAGPVLGRPHVDTLYGTSIANLKELRVQHDGRPLRILFAFDPRRVAYLILGGDKTGDKAWYDTFIPVAERIYRTHLKEIG
jgi:hypothetical protein